jgi:hypothetical protein
MTQFIPVTHHTTNERLRVNVAAMAAYERDATDAFTTIVLFTGRNLDVTEDVSELDARIQNVSKMSVFSAG